MGYPQDNFKGAVGGRINPPRNGGRPKKLSKRFIKDNALSRADAALLLKNAFLTPIKELADSANTGTETDPAIISITKKMVVQVYNSGRVSDMKDLYELAFGKEVETIRVENIDPHHFTALADTFGAPAEYEVIEADNEK